MEIEGQSGGIEYRVLEKMLAAKNEIYFSANDQTPRYSGYVDSLYIFLQKDRIDLLRSASLVLQKDILLLQQ